MQLASKQSTAECLPDRKRLPHPTYCIIHWVCYSVGSVNAWWLTCHLCVTAAWQ